MNLKRLADPFSLVFAIGVMRMHQYGGKKLATAGELLKISLITLPLWNITSIRTRNLLSMQVQDIGMIPICFRLETTA